MKINNLFYLFFVVFPFFVTSCNQKTNSGNYSNTEGIETNNTYVVPKAPDNIQGDEAKINYVFNHFWDDFNFRDTVKVFDPNYGEQAIVDYIGYFPLVGLDTLKEGVENVLNEAKLEPKVFEFFKYQFDNYLSNPNSPARNDLYYEVVLEKLISSGKISPDEKTKYESLLPLLRKNKPGTIATDFNYLMTDGHTANLKSIDAPFTLLMFYEPGCSTCEETIKFIKNNPGFDSILGNNALKILAVYPDGNMDIWKNYQKNIPPHWINGLDTEQTVVNKGLYMIKATPTIYLLDKDKKVILKDSNLNEVIKFFQSI